MSWRKDIDRILLPQKVWEEIVAHCQRKVAGNFLPEESKVNRAFGILAGVEAGRELHVRMVIPVKRNARNQEPLKSFMDKMMEEHAVPSTTPLSKRGWITDPEEFRECLDLCKKIKKLQDTLSMRKRTRCHVTLAMITELRLPRERFLQ
ncbi:MAG: hypothetical protein D3909_02955 [Candidatus Electrothrix sp. ATG1]|nr:hypothetical protein [Candidatus Electrothrix sp. ATG1]